MPRNKKKKDRKEQNQKPIMQEQSFVAVHNTDNPKSENTSKESATEQQRLEPKWLSFLKGRQPAFFSAAFAFIALLISGLMCWFSCQQVINSRQSAEAAKRSAANAEKSIALAEMSSRISNRAYVHAITAGIDTTADKLPRIKVYIMNNGQTPAYKVKTIGMFAIDTIECRNELTFENIKGMESVGLVPQKSHVWSMHPIKGSHNINALNRAIKGERFLQIYGWITYETIFAERCSTTYSLSYDALRKGFTVCPENNEDYYIKN